MKDMMKKKKKKNQRLTKFSDISITHFDIGPSNGP
jgi:hypothetical protein